ncbi:hypothetical protein [Butyricimonas paravirosa]
MPEDSPPVAAWPIHLRYSRCLRRPRRSADSFGNNPYGRYNPCRPQPAAGSREYQALPAPDLMAISVRSLYSQCKMPCTNNKAV